MKKLLKGIVDFRENMLLDYRSKFSKLAHRQSPDALFVACCDSRVVPNTFASSDPGDLFVLRNIGNIIPPYACEPHHSYQMDVAVAATIEFSLLNLNVQDIIICGHSECGAMQTLLQNTVQPSHLSSPLYQWVQYAASSYERFKRSKTKNPHISPCNFLSQINVIQQLENLKTYPWVMERLQMNKLRIHGWWFDLTTADVFYYEKQSDQFLLIDGEGAINILEYLG
ncbi:MAG: hypothetical protein A2103_01580 [Gammaproteobacteria bacterium GWF2_41_13]|nr:MAG: hypothetical protein A2103_01580 [Gammaproteobacteria bacterium GWF2_41_13]